MNQKRSSEERMDIMALKTPRKPKVVIYNQRLANGKTRRVSFLFTTVKNGEEFSRFSNTRKVAIVPTEDIVALYYGRVRIGG